MKEFTFCAIFALAAFSANAQAANKELAEPRRTTTTSVIELRRDYIKRYKLNERQALTITPLLVEVVNAGSANEKAAAEQRVTQSIESFRDKATVSK